MIRGFWLYVWKVTEEDRTVLYVGRTGDSSSPNAASPFSRLSRHLETRGSAKGNTMYRQLVGVGMDPTAASFEMAAVGPIFPEQKGRDNHWPIRDRVAAMERRLSDELEEAGWTVLGDHASRHHVQVRDRERYESTFARISEALQL